TVKNDQGTVAFDQVQLGYCHITAPISGRVGLRLVDPGNVVQASGTTTLAVITQLQPITVIFTIPEDSLGQVQPRLRVGAKLPVDTLQGATIIPSSAIQHNGPAAFVYVIQDNTAHQREVKPGVIEGNNTEVTGVEPGEVVADSSFDKLQDKAKVVVSKQPIAP